MGLPMSTSKGRPTREGPANPAVAEQAGRSPLMFAIFLLTFPGYFVYHYLVSIGVLPGFLAGYSTPICLATLPVLVGFHIQMTLNRPAQEPRTIERWLWIFLLYYALLTSWELATRNLRSGADAHPTVILQFVAMFMLGRHVPCEHQLRRPLLLAVLVMSGMIVHFATTGGLLAATLEAYGVQTDSLISYQGYAFAYFVTLSWLIPLMSERPWLRVSIYAIAFAALFLNGARSEFAVAVIAIACLEWFMTRSKGKALLWAGAAAMLLVLLYFAFESDLQDYRVITIFTDYDDDLSVQDRKGMHAAGLRSIMDNPWGGAFGSYVAGEYIHGYLSAWVDLGAPGFGLFLVLSLLPLMQLWIARRQLRDDQTLQLLLVLCVSTLLLSIAAKPFTQYMLPLTLGVAARSAAGTRSSRADRPTGPNIQRPEPA